MKHGSLFSGIGGFDLAAQWMGWENVFQCEKDEWCRKLLAKNFPKTKCYNDIKQFDTNGYRGAIDIISGGFPCQPFSTASRGRRVAEDLSGYMVKTVEAIKPKWIVGENVQEKPIKRIAEQFRNIGYATTHFSISADEIGADHTRNRWWVIAHSDNQSKFFSTINAKVGMLQKIQNDTWGWKNYSRTMGVHDGLSNRMDRLKGLGNAIVPQVAYQIFKSIQAAAVSPLNTKTNGA